MTRIPFAVRSTCVLSLCAALFACGAGSPAVDAGAVDAGRPQSLFEKYGGAATVAKLASDTGMALGSDCTQAPYFAKVGTPQGVSFQQLGACLTLQYTALLGGPATYPGRSPAGFDCRDMVASHTGLGIPANVFDRSIVILAGVFRSNGFTEPDTQTVLAALRGLKPDIVSSAPVTINACDGGQP